LPSKNGELAKSAARQGLQREADARFQHHIGFALEIEIDLHRAGPQHHVDPKLAARRHVAPHHLIAALGHPIAILALPFRQEAQAEHAEAELFGDLAHLLQMSLQLGASLVEIIERRARELELSAGLERDRPATIAGEADDVVAIEHGLPAEAAQAFEKGADPIRSFVRHRAQIGAAENEFLVLRADAPILGWLAACSEILDKLSLVGNRSAAGM